MMARLSDKDGEDGPWHRGTNSRLDVSKLRKWEEAGLGVVTKALGECRLREKDEEMVDV
jgi:hypothetical protein